MALSVEQLPPLLWWAWAHEKGRQQLAEMLGEEPADSSDADMHPYL